MQSRPWWPNTLWDWATTSWKDLIVSAHSKPSYRYMEILEMHYYTYAKPSLRHLQTPHICFWQRSQLPLQDPVLYCFPTKRPPRDSAMGIRQGSIQALTLLHRFPVDWQHALPHYTTREYRVLLQVPNYCLPEFLRQRVFHYPMQSANVSTPAVLALWPIWNTHQPGWKLHPAR